MPGISDVWNAVKKVIRYSFATIMMLSIIVTLTRVNNFIFVNRVKSFQHTLSEQRETAGGIEQTAMTDRIIEINEKITTGKVLANLPIISYFYIDEFRDIDLIK